MSETIGWLRYEPDDPDNGAPTFCVECAGTYERYADDGYAWVRLTAAGLDAMEPPPCDDCSATVGSDTPYGVTD